MIKGIMHSTSEFLLCNNHYTKEYNDCNEYHQCHTCMCTEYSSFVIEHCGCNRACTLRACMKVFTSGRCYNCDPRFSLATGEVVTSSCRFGNCILINHVPK